MEILSKHFFHLTDFPTYLFPTYSISTVYVGGTMQFFKRVGVCTGNVIHFSYNDLS